MTTLLLPKQAVICGMILLLSACAAVPKQSPSVLIAEVDTLISKVKRYNGSDTTAGDELRRAEQNLKHAKKALNKGDKIQAQQFAEKAQSDAEYAKAKVKVIIYKDQAQKKEELLKKFQEMHRKAPDK